MTVYVDLTDLYNFFTHHAHPTGIQRTCLEILETRCFEEGIADGRIRTVVYRSEHATFMACGYKSLTTSHQRLAQFMRPPKRTGIARVIAKAVPRGWRSSILPFDRARRRFFARFFVGTEPIAFGETDILLTPGAGWGAIEAAERAKQQGVRMAVINYDLLPIQFPAYFGNDDQNVRQYKHWINDIVDGAETVFSISQHTRQAYASAFPGRVARQSLPVIRLGNDHWRIGKSNHRSGEDVQPFVLNVSTIEVRKNHLTLLKAWERVVARIPSAPKLVIVGRRGWMADAFYERYARTNGAGGHVILRDDVPDAELARLYRDALFTVFPSFAEGWGLPVEESLMSGTPCIASNATSIPEVGGDLVDYVDPHDIDGMAAMIERYITDEAFRSARRHRIGQEFRTHAWEATAQQLIDSCRPART